MLRALLGLAQNGTFNNPTFTGVSKFANGSAGAPSIYFANDATTGLFSAGGGEFDVSVSGAQQVRFIGSGTIFPTPIFASSYVRTTAPVTKTGTTYTVADADNYIIANGSATLTLTLPAAATYAGRCIRVKTTAAFTVVSASSNVVPLAGGSAAAAILAATAGKWADLVSDGTNWVIMAGN